MHDFISRYFDGQLTAEEKEELFSHVLTDETWKKEFITLQNMYGLTSWLPGENEEAEAVAKLLAFKQTRKNEKGKTRFVNKQWWRYAAAITISILSSWTVFYFTQSNIPFKEQLAEVVYEEFTAPAGQRALIKLQDGTTVWLNASTTLRYPNRFSTVERRVELDGEAFFEVTANEELPFTVATEKLSIRVTGTKFNVFAYKGSNEFSTSLTEGTVTVYDSANEKKYIELLPNERAVLEGNRLVKHAFDNMNFLLWKDGIYAFDDIPFREIIKKLELYYDVKIVVNNKSLEEYRFSGKFRQRDGIESVLKTLKNIRNFAYTKDDEKNLITIQ